MAVVAEVAFAAAHLAKKVFRGHPDIMMAIHIWLTNRQRVHFSEMAEVAFAGHPDMMMAIHICWPNRQRVHGCGCQGLRCLTLSLLTHHHAHHCWRMLKLTHQCFRPNLLAGLEEAAL